MPIPLRRSSNIQFQASEAEFLAYSRQNPHRIFFKYDCRVRCELERNLELADALGFYDDYFEGGDRRTDLPENAQSVVTVELETMTGR
jgi:hypothetical protein